MNRRDFLKSAAAIAAVARAAAETEKQLEQAKRSGTALVIDTQEQFEVSPFLNMQFMEPLGVTDSSVEAAWDYNRDDWRRDFVELTRTLAPGMIRYGGLFSRYYKWREGVGPAAQRPWMRNYVWGGKETNRVGTGEFVDFCRRTGAQPLYCVNFLSDGEQRFGRTAEGNRTGDGTEAADWVSYANDPENRERREHGAATPYGIKYWQLGNETSYGGNTTFSKAASIAATRQFSAAMRARDMDIQLIGWGDNDWAGDLVKEAGEHINLVAVHMMGQTPLRKETVLRGLRYQSAPEQAWQELLEMIPERIEKKLVRLEQTLAEHKAPHGIAITEGHVSFAPHNSNPILLEWLTGVYHAMVMNLYQRHGARVKIATIADFNGTRWTNCAVIHQVPGNISFLTPAGAVAQLFKPVPGEKAVSVLESPSDLDVTATRVGNTFRLRIANKNYSRAVEAGLAVRSLSTVAARKWEISPENPRQEVSVLNPDVFKARSVKVEDPLTHRFPARSVTLIELECATA